MLPDEIEILPDETSEADPIVVGEPLIDYFLDQNVSISLKYYDKRPECWSEWKKPELKAFTKTIGLLSQQTANQIRSGNTPKCKPHKGPTQAAKFVRPDGLSEDIDFWEIGVNNEARVHGFFVQSVFFLVWLDRSHRVFP